MSRPVVLRHGPYAPIPLVHELPEDAPVLSQGLLGPEAQELAALCARRQAIVDKLAALHDNRFVCNFAFKTIHPKKTQPLSFCLPKGIKII